MGAGGDGREKTEMKELKWKNIFAKIGENGSLEILEQER